MPVLRTDSRSSTDAEHLRRVAAAAPDQVPDQLGDAALLVPRGQRDHQPVRREQLGQQHGTEPGGMGQT